MFENKGTEQHFKEQPRRQNRFLTNKKHVFQKETSEQQNLIQNANLKPNIVENIKKLQTFKSSRNDKNIFELSRKHFL